eukprot:RCo006686
MTLRASGDNEVLRENLHVLRPQAELLPLHNAQRAGKLGGRDHFGAQWVVISKHLFNTDSVRPDLIPQMGHQRLKGETAAWRGGQRLPWGGWGHKAGRRNQSLYGSHPARVFHVPTTISVDGGELSHHGGADAEREAPGKLAGCHSPIVVFVKVLKECLEHEPASCGLVSKHSHLLHQSCVCEGFQGTRLGGAHRSGCCCEFRRLCPRVFLQVLFGERRVDGIAERKVVDPRRVSRAHRPRRTCEVEKELSVFRFCQQVTQARHADDSPKLLLGHRPTPQLVKVSEELSDSDSTLPHLVLNSSDNLFNSHIYEVRGLGGGYGERTQNTRSEITERKND